ncbi:MAG: GSU3473 family protein [bacterium]
MLIRVKFRNNKYNYIKPGLLDRMIETGRVEAFCRGTAWVVIGKDRIRMNNTPPYEGIERRGKEPYNPFVLVYMALVLSYDRHLD